MLIAEVTILAVSVDAWLMILVIFRSNEMQS